MNKVITGKILAIVSTMITLYSAICFPYISFRNMFIMFISVCLSMLMQIVVNAIKSDELYEARILANTCLFINCILYIILICYLFNLHM